ncbi:hypothetical protein SPRG_19808 [Saprolegnia parasitica CBS 223.65]|uniref:Ankyrin repeat domain containing protein n=1 Tax=Saprolegnia parasitica (strain CBS 223.65) TaxID=695850 RepID=A0A067CID6_SAPPC|nr:hypothetical protein SPRG_19808 [Saprolegnia parasitica CBS 223.65]KDO30258.1 hypothetical protein SPRG_19808 [Saprolegnia parasitica CBS 223.65]|eukprot:XP_012199061.1 hypothetical protein SPRG_19808 [Saprolegnia parasitica CBS 223.65]
MRRPAAVVLAQADLVRSIAAYQDGIPYAISALDHVWKTSVTFRRMGSLGLGFSYAIDGVVEGSHAALHLLSVDHRFPMHWAMLKGRDDECIAWAAHFQSTLLALEAFQPSAVTCAARYGRGRVVRWLLDHGFSMTPESITQAVLYGDVALVALLCERAPTMVPGRVLAAAAACGHLDVARYLHAHFPQTLQSSGVLSAATTAPMNAEPMLRFVSRAFRGLRPTGRDLSLALCQDSLPLLSMVMDLFDDPPMTSSDTYFALTREYAGAHPETMALLIGRCAALGLPTELRHDQPAYCNWASIVNSLCDIRSSDAGVKEQALLQLGEAPPYGCARLELVQWLVRHGCSVSSEGVDAAARCGAMDIVRFLDEACVDGFSPTTMNVAAEHGHLDIVRYLHEHRHEGCTHRCMDAAAANGDMAMLAFLHERRSEGCSTDAIDHAVFGGHFDVVMYLLTHREEGFTSAALDTCRAKAMRRLLEANIRRMRGRYAASRSTPALASWDTM